MKVFRHALGVGARARLLALKRERFVELEMSLSGSELTLEMVLPLEGLDSVIEDQATTLERPSPPLLDDLRAALSTHAPQTLAAFERVMEEG